MTAMLPQSLSNSRSAAMLTIEWTDGQAQQLSNRLLRGSCKCTECESARRQGSLEAPPAVWIEQINPIGTYGVQLVFSDGHERGIFPWMYLRSLNA